jgi:large subunit ribosomal protein L7/L12
MDNTTALLAAGGFLLGWAIGYFTARKKSPAITPQGIIEAMLMMGRDERAALREAIERRLGPADPSAEAASPAVGDDPSAPKMDLILVDAGTDKIAVIKVIRELTGLGLKESKELADQGGSVVLTGAKARVARGREELESAGALTEIRNRA